LCPRNSGIPAAARVILAVHDFIISWVFAVRKRRINVMDQWRTIHSEPSNENKMSDGGRERA